MLYIVFIKVIEPLWPPCEFWTKYEGLGPDGGTSGRNGPQMWREHPQQQL